MSLPNAVPGIFASIAKIVSIALATYRDLGPPTQQDSVTLQIEVLLIGACD
jgi:hypothetical protein